ncbi:LysR substrate-binding domain-containing protein [Pseudoroseicyclus tamaricis]|uniref:LysR family transcriptional regulator n=1 Tax=Pseudoroseicyclus tamaricis TaxID=2705421 RepID=A0A6B2K129_9RHOB|nr:LysR substrate-binding domain-containing protein [Pseudoroseicyclus tamaricis]NDV02649.1 LysR family transcriptional regulator [Pseudoroseicyclus tamaricis]
MDWRTLPPLASLRAFEAAARTRGFTRAAEELNVTHAAIVQQVRSLESALGLPLARREGRGIALTEEGAALSAALTKGFEEIELAVAELKGRDEGGPLRVSMTPRFATHWLVPRLGAFWKLHPDIPISMSPSRELVDLTRDHFDLAIRFGDGNWPGLETERLFSAHFTIVASPRLGLKGPLTVEELAEQHWIIEDDWPEQFAYLSRQGLDISSIRRTHMPTEDMAASAVDAGIGIGAAITAMAQDDLDAGRLVALHATEETRLGYWICRRPGPVREDLRTFLRWLRSEV